MTNQIITDSFETLGGVVQSTGQQVKQAVKKIPSDVAEQLGIQQSSSENLPPEAKNPPAQNTEQYKKTEEAGKKRTAAKYKQIQEEINQIAQKRKQEIEKYRMPGFTDEEKQKKQVEQLQQKEDPEKKLPPLPVQRAQKKTEMNRGVSG